MIDAASRPRTHGAASPAGGLGAPAAVVLLAVVTTAAAVISASTGRGFGIAYNLVYLLITVYVALRIHVEDRFTAVVAPPLVYAVATFVGGIFDSEVSNHSLQRLLENAFVNMSFGAPWLVGTTVVTIVIAVVRGRRADVRHR